MLRQFFRLSILLGFLCASGLSQAYAQPLSATFDWEVSTDHGRTWVGSAVSVLTSRRDVLVRARVQWTPPSPNGFRAYFNRSAFDVTITSLDAGGAGDFADSFANEDPTGPYENPGGLGFAAFRFGTTLKIDAAFDTDPPGVGSFWVAPFDLSPNQMTIRRENPVFLFQFRLLLDGTPGRREISSVPYIRPGDPPDSRVWVWVFPYTGLSARVPTTFTPITISVLPRCLADVDDGSGTGVPDNGVTIDDLLYYLDLYASGDVRADLTAPPPMEVCCTEAGDGGVTIDDLLCFLCHFENGC